LKHTSVRAIQLWRNFSDEEVEKLYNDNRKRRKLGVSKFPTIENELIKRREIRVKKARNRSKHWMQKESLKIIGGVELL
jgi:hypothetical protein